uniref:protein ITPRID1 n=1 Tax=Semicossyphus pulcher TaxID=241346 RepID=UPI0037E6F927
MASKDAEDRRANLVASRVHWSHMDLCEPTRDQETQELLRRNTSSDDDLALGVEASLYGNPGVRTVQDFLRWSRSSPAVSRWNSLNSTASDHSGPLSVMDILNLWNDDPEEVLLEMGFGCDEPDLSGRIPARFINYQSQARGINLQVFLEAQKSRLDLENPDVSNRFRQLEVLQQVTTAFSSLVGSASPLSAPRGKDLLPEARERRKRMGMLFRRASKKSLSHVKSHTTKDLTASTTFLPCAAPDSHHPPSSLGDNRIPLKRIKTGLLETSNLSPLAEEQGVGPDAQLEPQEASMIVQDGALRSWPMREGRPLTANPFLQRKKSPGQARESFEMEEIHSFDESNVTGSFTGAAEHFVRCVARTNSCQSDSSGFLEEPFIPAHSQQESPAPDLIKALSCLSGGSTDSHSSERPGSPSPSSPLSSSSLLLCSSLKSPGVDKSLLSSSCPSLEQSLVIDHSPSPVSLCPQKSDNEVSETEATPDQDESQSASGPPSVHEYLPSCSLSLDLQNTSEIPPSPVSFTSLSPSTSLIEPASLMKVSEEIKTEEKNSPALHLSTLSYDPDGTAYSDFSCVPPPALPPPSTPNLDLAFSSISSSGGPGNTQSQQTHKNSPSASSGLSSLNPFSPELQINPKDPVFQDSGGKVLSDPPSFTQQKEETEMPYFLPSLLDQDSPLAPPAFILDSSSNGEEAPQPCLSPNHSIPDCQSALSSKLHDQERLINPTVGRISDFTVKPDQDRPCSNDDNTDIDSAFPVQEVFPAEIYHLPLDLQDTPQRNGKGEMEDWQSYDSLHGMDRDCPTVSVSLDKGLWSDDEEEVDRNGNEDEKNLWEGNQTATMACCCSCDDHGNSCYNMQQTMGNIPYSLDELEEMVLCLQQFRSVLCNMEEQLSEDQASVYSALSDQDREKVRDIEELRQAVKKEAGELEMQLNELAHHYDDSLKMKMHRLLDEQSLLCTQLRVPLPGKVPTSLCPVPNRTVSTQCSLLHRMPSVDVQGDHVSSWNTWNENSPRQSPPGSDSICEGLNCSSTKVDKVDIVSFLQRLKETLRHSVNTDSLE